MTNMCRGSRGGASKAHTSFGGYGSGNSGLLMQSPSTLQDLKARTVFRDLNPSPSFWLELSTTVHVYGSLALRQHAGVATWVFVGGPACARRPCEAARPCGNRSKLAAAHSSAVSPTWLLSFCSRSPCTRWHEILSFHSESSGTCWREIHSGPTVSWLLFGILMCTPARDYFTQAGTT